MYPVSYRCLFQYKALICGPAVVSEVEKEPASVSGLSAGLRAPGRKGPPIPELEAQPREGKGEGNTKVV